MKMVCRNCGTQGEPKTRTKGSLIMEIMLWVCFLLPGMLYSVWRLSTRAKVCGGCDSTELVPSDSPVGKKLIAG